MRDLVVVGCSAGGVGALPRLLGPLGPELRASICVVQHLSARYAPHLVEILARTVRLQVAWAEQCDRLRHGHVYVAPPDVHLLIVDDHLQLAKSERENHARPSIDKLFRSAAAVHGSRVIGVLLTGMLSDGVAGLAAIRDAGGLVIIQDPADAEFPDLPRHALEVIDPDWTLAAEQIGIMLPSLVEPAP